MLYKLTKDLKPLCCDNILKKGTLLKVVEIVSKNRILIQTVDSAGFHKIKKSTLNRIGEKI